MSGEVFVDTNVLVYARDASEGVKQPVAAAWLEALWRSRRGRLSVQILTEYYATVTRKLDPGLPVATARADVRNLAAWRPVPLTATVLDHAFDLQDRFSLSWWDALVVAAAHVAGCRWLLTEDLQDGLDLDGLTVLDPFRHGPDTIR